MRAQVAVDGKQSARPRIGVARFLALLALMLVAARPPRAGARGTLEADAACAPLRLALIPPSPVASKDPLETILCEADTLGMHVLPGIGCYAFFDFTPASLEWHKQIAGEVWQRYGHHPSFYGWYVSQEIAGSLGAADRRRQELVDFFRDFRAYLRALAPEKPVMLATNAHGIRNVRGLLFFVAVALEGWLRRPHKRMDEWR